MRESIRLWALCTMIFYPTNWTCLCRFYLVMFYCAVMRTDGTLHYCHRYVPWSKTSTKNIRYTGCHFDRGELSSRPALAYSQNGLRWWKNVSGLSFRDGRESRQRSELSNVASCQRTCQIKIFEYIVVKIFFRATTRVILFSYIIQTQWIFQWQVKLLVLGGHLSTVFFILVRTNFRPACTVNVDVNVLLQLFNHLNSSTVLRFAVWDKPTVASIFFSCPVRMSSTVLIEIWINSRINSK